MHQSSLRSSVAVSSLSVALLALTAGAQSQLPGQVPNLPDLGPAGTVPGAPVMTKANVISGIGQVVTGGNSHTGGCAWVDYNGDYFADLFILNGGGSDHYLFLNNGDGTFTDQSSLVPKGNVADEDAGVACADIDNDGDTDILVAVDNATYANMTGFNVITGGPNLLYVNQGDGTFVEAAAANGLVDARGWRNITANFADIDNDGWVDAYLGAWAPNNGPYNRDNVMYKNDGDGTFTAHAAGTEANGLDTLAVLIFDANMDLIPDIYVGNAAAIYAPPLLDCRDVFFHGGAGGTFSDVTVGSPGIGNDACGNMGMDVGDIDNDGDWDLYCTDIDHDLKGNWLYLGNPDGSLTDNSAINSGISATYSWPTNFADFNRDGWTDIWAGSQWAVQPSWIFFNDRDGTFSAHNPAGWGGADINGGSIADYDGDGDVDVFMWVNNGTARLFRNDAQDANNYVQFKLIGQTTNRDAIGATVKVTSSGITQMRRVSGGDSAHSQQEQILHFGVAKQAQVDVEVLWPSGTVQSFTAMGTNQLHVIDEDAGALDQALVWSETRLDRASGTLSVRAWTNYRGRTQLTAEGLGELNYNARALAFEGSFDLRGRPVPATIQLTSERGKSWELQVDAGQLPTSGAFGGASTR